MTLDDILLTLVCSFATFSLVLVITISLYALRRLNELTKKCERIESSHVTLSNKVVEARSHQQKLFEIVEALSKETRRITHELLVTKQSLSQQKFQAVDHDRLTALFENGHADVKLAQSLGISRGEAELMKRFTPARTAQ